MPSTGPRSPEMRIRILEISWISHQGQMRMPMMPVRIPPVRYEIHLGNKFEKAVAGAITLAAMLVERVATSIMHCAAITTQGEENRAKTETGSHGASSAIMTSGKMSKEAQVTKTPTKEKSIMVPGSPMNCPAIWAFWLLANRVMSEMLMDMVAQNPTMAVNQRM